MTVGMSGAVTLRDEQARAVRDRLVNAAIAMVEAGEEPNMRAVAKTAGVSERTIYRYFPAREDLFAALLPILRIRASVPMVEYAADLEKYARDLYTTFDANARLVRALVSASWAAPIFERTRAANLQALQAVLDRSYPLVPRGQRRAAAVALRVPLSGSGWAYLSDCEFSLKESIGHLRWLIRTVLRRLEEASGGNHA